MGGDVVREFMVADLNSKGELQGRQLYSYSALEQIQGATDLIIRSSSAIWREPDGFQIPLNLPPGEIVLRWVPTAKTAGIATIWNIDGLLSLSLLVCAIDPQVDAITLQTFQSHLLRELHDTGIEPAFDLMNIVERPMIATINFRSPDQPHEQYIVALADRCFAAAYFRSQSLA
jgi:hypothetical protein